MLMSINTTRIISTCKSSRRLEYDNAKDSTLVPSCRAGKAGGRCWGSVPAVSWHQRAPAQRTSCPSNMRCTNSDCLYEMICKNTRYSLHKVEIT
ncbi:hypothetical protein HW555_002970 [Spodoptera exigua]|uniref:Uncharacterized protein n=1 Tax=Spodoptera exigua TaxID=7107 RepID=A0A835GPX3_SPOEX|nr:hypothetical protein HW555_002970 [Spodoptera exigua]